MFDEIVWMYYRTGRSSFFLLLNWKVIKTIYINYRNLNEPEKRCYVTQLGVNFQ